MKEYINMLLLLVCAYFLYSNLSFIYNYGNNDFIETNIILPENNGLKLSEEYLQTNSIPLSKNDLSNIAIKIINVNIMIICIVLIMNDFISSINAAGGLKKCLRV